MKNNKKTENNIVIFSDFDGTITKKDIGDELFIQFGEFEPYHSKLVKGEMRITDYWKRVCSTLKTGITKAGIESFSIKFEVDSYFKAFSEYCRNLNIPLNILSDGFNAYINPVLESIGCEWIPLFCNKLIFVGNKPTVPEFPLASESCNCLCASCKRNAMLTGTDSDAVIIFIGDGYSDFCAAEHSDIIFAKKSLAAYCNEKKLPHYPFSSFFDVYRILQDLQKKGGYKQRNQAKLLRKKAFENE